MATQYSPITLCTTHNISMHDDSRSQHEHNWASPEYPCNYSYPSDADMRAAGWTPSDFTSWPYGTLSESATVAAENEFWGVHYAV